MRVLVVVLLLAGCVGMAQPGELVLEAATPGRHQTTGPCDGQGTLQYAFTSDGKSSLAAEILDPTGASIWTSSLSGRMTQSSGGTTLSAMPGTWVLRLDVQPATTGHLSLAC
jgi:hypothetical protein